MQSLKQNAPIKYIINCFQIWNRHVFIKCKNKKSYFSWQVRKCMWCNTAFLKTPCMPILAESRWNIEVLFPSQTSRSGQPLFFVFFLRFWGVSTKSDISAIVNHKPDRTEFIQSVCDVTRCSYLPNRSTNPTFFSRRIKYSAIILPLRLNMHILFK